MKWTDIQYFVDQNALVLFPLGVLEEHGPQLCLGTDIFTAHVMTNISDIADRVSAAIAARRRAA